MMSVISYWEITSNTLVTKIQNYTPQSSLSHTHICVLYTADGCWCDIFCQSASIIIQCLVSWQIHWPWF